MSRVYRILLLAFPARTRRAVGDEMARLFEDERRVVSGRPLAIVVLWIRVASDALRHGLAERIGNRMSVSTSPAARPLLEPPFVIDRPTGADMLHHLVSIVRWSYRSLRATPLVSTLAVLSLALGIGANTALFSIINGLLLKPMPVRDPGSLYAIAGHLPYPVWREIQARQRQLFDRAFAWSDDRFNRAAGGESRFLDGAYVSGEMFDLLGVRPERGRLLGPSDDVVGGGAQGLAAVISHRFWQAEFAGGDDVVGRTLTLDRVPFTIVGVAPARFNGPGVGRIADVFVPFGAEPRIRATGSFLDARSVWWIDIMLRARPGQGGAGAAAALHAAQQQIREATVPTNFPPPMQAGFLREPLRLISGAAGLSPMENIGPLAAMLVVVVLVLLIACANIANLLIARALARRHELGVRLALGGSRGQVAALLFGESLLLATAGAAAGLLLAQWAGPLLVSQFSTWEQTVTLDLSPDWRILAFTLSIAVGTALVAGVAPAWSINRVAPIEAIGAGGRGVVGPRRVGARNLLVAVQLALSIVLVIAAGLFLRTFSALASAPLGFTPEPLVVAQVDFEQSGIAMTDRPAVIERMRASAAALPGVTSASVSLITPISGRSWNSVVGEDPVPDRSRMTWLNALSPGWFRTYEIPLVVGRDFDASDRASAEPVAIVNQVFAARFVEGPPVGQTVGTGGPGGKVNRHRIIGVVGDAAYRSAREGMMPTMYVAATQGDRGPLASTLTVAVSPAARAAVMRDLGAAIRQVDPDATFTFRTFDELIDATISRERLVAVLSVFFGGLALLLAGIGLYGVMSYAVSQRRTEIGVRMALGAEPAGIVGLVFRQFGVLVLSGVGAGVALAFWTARFAETLLFGLDARDPLTFGAAVLILIAVAFLAALLPARRAARLDPAKVLREG